jgi:arylformamidase
MSTHDTTWLEAQFNNRARVPEHAAIFERWARASERVREGLTTKADMRYGGGPNETFDIFPARKPDSPVLVFIHGGWWRSLDKRDHSFVAASLVSAGAMVVVPNYALCPGTSARPTSIETITLQMVRALESVYRYAERFGGNPRHIVVAGHSAGGQLAAMMLQCEWQRVAADLPADLVRAALSISGVHDLEPVRQTPSLQADLRLTPEAVNKLSPAYMAAPERGRLYAAVGALESEEFLRQTRLIQEAWGPQTVPVCETVPDTNHFTVLRSLADPEGRLHHLALELLGLRE